jgi:hypothetical protein
LVQLFGLGTSSILSLLIGQKKKVNSWHINIIVSILLRLKINIKVIGSTFLVC